MPGSRSNLDVYLRLHGQRKFAKEVATSGAELEAMGLKGAKSMAAFAKSAKALKSFGASWTRHVSLPIAGLGVIAGGMAVNFRRQMGLVATDAGGTAKEVERLEKSVLGLARESQFGPQKLAESLFHVESAGFRGAKAMRVLRESQKLATTGNSDLEETTYALVSANKALYGESVKHVHRTAAELNGIVAHGDMRLEELVGGLGSGLLAKAKAMGLGLRDVGAALDVMTARGIKAERASYALGFTMQKLVPYGEKAEKAFASIGLGEETLINASQHGKFGYVTGLEVLQKHLDMLPTKAQQTKVIEEMFGGGRMTSGLLTDLQNLGEMKKIYGELGHEVTIYNKHAKEASEQPKVELEEAWSSVSADLTEIGGDLLPEVVPAVKDMAKFSGKAAAFFQKIPGPVKAIGVGALVAIGPLSSMLGYLAQGTGRFLVVANAMAKAGVRFNATLSPNVMTEKSGFKGALSAAFGGTGAAGALSAAKGFATVIGPAVAAAGIGKIVFSATEGDWKGVGLEAGGAAVGGIAAVLMGNPELAPLAAGLGSFAGSAISGLFSSSPKISKLRAQTEHLTQATKELRESLQGIKPAEEGLAKARQRHSGASKEEFEADRKLHHALAIYGESSWQAHKAQLALWRAQRKVIHTGKEEAAMHRKTGNQLALYRENSIKVVGSLKQQMPTLRRRIKILNQEHNQGKLSHEGLVELVKLEGRLTREKHELTKEYARAETVAGKPWAKRLESLTRLQAEYGRTGKGLITRMDETRGKMELETKEGLETTKMFKHQGRELKRLLGLYEQVNELGPFRPEGVPLGKTVPPRSHPLHGNRHHPKGKTGSSAQARRLSSTKPGALHINTTPVAQSGSGRDINVTVQSVLDGRVVAESTTKVAKQAALLQ